MLADHGPGDRATRRRRYARYLRAAVGERLEPPWAEALEGLVIGSSDFLERLRSSSGVERPDPERKGSRAMAARPSAGVMAEEAAEALELDPNAWAEGPGTTTLPAPSRRMSCGASTATHGVKWPRPLATAAAAL